MQETLVHSVLLSVPQAATIWLVILAVAVIAVAALSLSGLRPTRDDPEPPGRRVDAAGLADAAGFAAERASADRYAEEIEVAAARAAVTAQRGRDAWERAQEHLDVTWAAFEAADRVALRTTAAAAVGMPDDARPEFDGSDPDAPHGAGPVAPHGAGPVAPHGAGRRVTAVDRERYLHRAATAACRRRELSVSELNDILAHRAGWDPRCHPVEQEVALHQAVRRRALAAYRDAATRERQAWHTAETAAEALRSLRAEACAARLQAEVPPVAAPLWWAGEVYDTAQVPSAAPRSDEFVTALAQPLQVSVDDVETTIILPVQVSADDVETTIILPVQVSADDVETTIILPVGSVPVGPLRVVPLPAAAVAALQATTAQLPTVTPTAGAVRPGQSSSRSPSPAQAGPVVPAQAGAPSAESLRRPLAAAGIDPSDR